jgi:hypothetical protein
MKTKPLSIYATHTFAEHGTMKTNPLSTYATHKERSVKPLTLPLLPPKVYVLWRDIFSWLHLYCSRSKKACSICEN